MSSTWNAAPQRKHVPAFVPVDVVRPAKFPNDLDGLQALLRGEVLRAEFHVSPVKPLHARGAGRAAVHLDTWRFFLMRPRAQRVRGRRGEALRPDPSPARNEERLCVRARSLSSSNKSVLMGGGWG